jgi:hypothetical protein
LRRGLTAQRPATLATLEDSSGAAFVRRPCSEILPVALNRSGERTVVIEGGRLDEQTGLPFARNALSHSGAPITFP